MDCKKSALQRAILASCAALILIAGSCEAKEASAAISLDRLPTGWRDDNALDFPFSTLHGHRVVLTMAYASCHRICPMTIDELKHMQNVADARHEVLDFVIVSYDPKNDNPAVWHRYRQSRRLNRSNWHFLCGSREVTEQLARELGFPFWTFDEHVMHESRVVLFDSQGNLQAALGLPTSHWADAL